MVHVYLRREVVGNSVQIQQKTQSGPSVNRPVVQDRLHSGESRHQPSSYSHGHVFPDKFGVQKMGCNQSNMFHNYMGPFPEGERAAFGDQGLKKEWWFSARVPILLKGESITVERFAYSFFGVALGRMRSNDCKMSLDLVWSANQPKMPIGFSSKPEDSVWFQLGWQLGGTQGSAFLRGKAPVAPLFGKRAKDPGGVSLAGPVYQPQENGNLSIRLVDTPLVQNSSCFMPKAIEKVSDKN